MALPEPIKAKSIIFDVADNHGNATYAGIRQIDFWYKGEKIFQYPVSTYNTHETSEESATNESENAFNCSLLKTGSASGQGFIFGTSNVTDQRLICVFDNLILFDEIRINNYHDAGTDTNSGFNNVKIYASLDSITDTVYGNTINRSRIVFDGAFSEHSASDIEDEENLALTDGFKYLTFVNCADSKEWLLRLRDFVCKRAGTYDYSTTGIGWSLIDSSYAIDEDNLSAGDWFVIKTTGNHNDFEYCVKFIYQTTAIQVQTGLYWNTSTHVMATEPGDALTTRSVITITSGDIPVLAIYGDLDAIQIFGRKTAAYSNWYLFLWGRVLSCGPSDFILTATGTYTSGSDVSMTFNEELPDDWVVGNSIVVWSGAGDGFDVVEIKTVDIGTKTITVDLVSSLPTATVRACRHFGLLYSINSNVTYSAYILISNDNNENVSVTERSIFMETGIYDGCDPDPLDDQYYCSNTYLWGSNGFAGRVPFAIQVPQVSSSPTIGDTLTTEYGPYKVISGVKGSGITALREF